VRVGLFQLLPQPEGRSEPEVIEQALWEVDFAEQVGLDRVWLTEHHASSFGLVGATSVYAAAVAGRTRRLGIGYAVAVLPLHHPLRLAEELSWVDHLSRGRLRVGVGAGFIPGEFAAFGVPLAERQARFEEALEILCGLLGHESFEFRGRYWSLPPVTLKPRPYTVPHPPLLMAISSEPAAALAAARGLAPLIGLRPAGEIHRLLEAYGGGPRRLEGGLLRRVYVGATDQEAEATLAFVGGLQPEGLVAGSAETVRERFEAMESFGLGELIVWMNFAGLPLERVRQSMSRFAEEVLPSLQDRVVA
jgi:alkanesulfonate monooxygenase SsuD/methylene tetrahydromethanopterin reductase-like flavin-dependent oxidoreductase (luciferase family)